MPATVVLPSPATISELPSMLTAPQVLLFHWMIRPPMLKLAPAAIVHVAVVFPLFPLIVQLV